MNQKSENARSISGKVISSKMSKTVVVEITRTVAHPIYGKFTKRSGKIMAHDEKQEANEGDVVRVIQCRPISKGKSWKLEKII